MTMQTRDRNSFKTDFVDAKVPGRPPFETSENRAVEEHRASLRQRVLKGANIYFNRGYGAYSCTVKNLSAGGVMVLMEDSSGLPSEFDFRINGEAQIRKASICWRSNGKAGMRFV